MKDIFWIIIYVSMVSPLLGLAIFVTNYFFLKLYFRNVVLTLVIGRNKHVKRDRCISLIAISALVSFAASTSNLLYVLAGHQGAFINNSYNLVQFILLSAFYHYLHEEKATFRNKKIAVIGVLLVLASSLANALWVGTFQQYQTLPWILQCSLLVVYSVYSVFRLRGGPLVDDRQMSVLGEDMYSTIVKIVSAPVWFNTGILLYFSGSLLIAGIELYIGPELFAQRPYIWIFHNALNITKNSFFTIGIYRAVKYGMARRLKLAPGRYVPLEAN